MFDLADKIAAGMHRVLRLREDATIASLVPGRTTELGVTHQSPRSRLQAARLQAATCEARQRDNRCVTHDDG